MGRQKRYIPGPDSVFEITCEVHRKHLLRDLGEEQKELLLGVVGRGLALYPAVRFHYFVAVTDHYHLLITPPDVETLSKFMNHVNSNIAKEIRRANGLSGVIWARRFRATPQTKANALESVLRHLIAHDLPPDGCDPGQLPRSRSLRALWNGDALSGKWFDHTREYRSGRRKRTPPPRPEAFVQPYELTLDPLPGWKEYTAEARQEKLCQLGVPFKELPPEVELTPENPSALADEQLS